MLRDALTRLDGLGTWPCDEINYIWRHGNRGYPNDAIPAAHATVEVRDFINNSFGRVRRQTDCSAVVEKTCANSLRVPFVHRVMPHARFLYIYRDGIDAAVSARSRWKAPLDVRYVARKARFLPPSDAPYYASRYFKARVKRLTSSERRLGTWGPRPLRWTLGC